jgi:heme/copper-type cytochrome/quinol oxidase subunit 2
MAAVALPASRAGRTLAGRLLQQPHTIEKTVTAFKYGFDPALIEVQQGDILKITLQTRDIAHSFTIDEPYRIAKRANPGHPVTFEFRADKAGTFTYYCNITTDEGCRQMKGQLVVHPARVP